MSAAAAAVIPSKPAAPPPSPPKFVPSQLLELASIEADPHNPRKDFPKDALAELAASIGLHGVLSPIEVRPVAGGKHRIVFGERRFRAAKLAGLEKIPAIVRQLTDLQAAEEQLDENIKRAELSPLEVAGGYQRQLELGRTMDQVCERAGKKRSAVYATLQLLQLGAEGRKSLGEEKISASVAQLVARVPKSLQPRALSLVEGTEHQAPLSFREAERELQQAFTVELKKAPFDTKDEKLCPPAGSCEKCPKRSGNAADLFPDIKSPDVCTDKSCFDAKVHADVKRVMDAKGYKLLTPKEAPAEDLFWNQGTGPLKDDSYVEPDAVNYDDTQNRKYRELLEPEHFKKLAVVALDSNGKPRQLLPKAGLARELKKGGLFREKTARQVKAPAPAKSSAPKEHVPPPPSVDELVDRALVAKMVDVVEKKGATPSVLKLMIREALPLASETDIEERRGWKNLGPGRLSDKELNKAVGPLPTSKLVGLLFEALIGSRYMNGDGFEDIARELGVDVEKVAVEVNAGQLPPPWARHGDGFRATFGTKKYEVKPVGKDSSAWQWLSGGSGGSGYVSAIEAMSGAAFAAESIEQHASAKAKTKARRAKKVAKPAKKGGR